MKMKRGLFILSLIFGTAFLIKGQAYNDIFNQIIHNNPYAEIEIDQQEDIRRLFEKHLNINKKHKKIPGYQVRVFSDLSETAKDEALKVKGHIYQLYGEDIPVYIVYNDPYYKVYVGDFKTKNDAVIFLNEIRRFFPNAFLRDTRINYPDLNRKWKLNERTD